MTGRIVTMAKIKHLTKKKVEHVTNELWEIESSLKGLGSLFQYRDDEGGIHLDTGEFFGIGHLLKGIAKRVSVLEDILRCGHDSMAITQEKELIISEKTIEQAKKIFDPSLEES